MKPENILLKSKGSDQIKIIDLGLSQTIKKNKSLQKEAGSIYYLAPEMIKLKYNHKVDIWSIGVIFYILVTGNPPFNAIDQTGVDYDAIKEKILVGQVDLLDEAFLDVDPEVPDIIELMLTLDPNQRPDAKDILDHPWFKAEVSPTEKNTGLL